MIRRADPMADPRSSELVDRIARQHGLSVAEIADGTGYSTEQTRRILSGQYPPTVALLRYLYRRTRDHAVLRLVLGADDVAVIASDEPPLDPACVVTQRRVAQACTAAIQAVTPDPERPLDVTPPAQRRAAVAHAVSVMTRVLFALGREFVADGDAPHITPTGHTKGQGAKP